MSGTHEGGLKTYQTNLEKHGKDFYSEMGKLGGAAPHKSRGFNSDKIGKDGLTGRERARVAGRKGLEARWQNQR